LGKEVGKNGELGKEGKEGVREDLKNLGGEVMARGSMRFVELGCE